MRKRALLEAIRFCGGVTAYSRRLKVSRTRASNWCNKPEIEIPYEYAVLTEDITQVSIERLSPHTEVANKVIRRLRTNNKIPPIFVDINSINIENLFISKCTYKDRPIIIGTDGVLISGLPQLDAQKASKQRKIQVTVLDLEAIVLGQRSLKELNVELLISEKVAIGIRLEELLSKRRTQRNDIKSEPVIDRNMIEESVRPIWDKENRIDSYVAYLIGLNSKNTYHRAKQVCLQGNIELISAMDKEEISIAMGAQQIKSKGSKPSSQIDVQKPQGGQSCLYQESVP